LVRNIIRFASANPRLFGFAQEDRTVSNSLTAKLWIVVRFLLFGVGGFLLMLVAWLFFLDRLNSHSAWPLVFAPMGILGAFSMLYGVGEWGRWVYLGVFLSIPLSMLLWLVPFYPVGKLEGAAAPALVALVAYVLAKWHYWRAESQGLER
jgi:hypothetical protein